MPAELIFPLIDGAGQVRGSQNPKKWKSTHAVGASYFTINGPGGDPARVFANECDFHNKLGKASSAIPEAVIEAAAVREQRFLELVTELALVNRRIKQGPKQPPGFDVSKEDLTNPFQRTFDAFDKMTSLRDGLRGINLPKGPKLGPGSGTRPGRRAIEFWNVVELQKRKHYLQTEIFMMLDQELLLGADGCLDFSALNPYSPCDGSLKRFAASALNRFQEEREDAFQYCSGVLGGGGTFAGGAVPPPESASPTTALRSYLGAQYALASQQLAESRSPARPVARGRIPPMPGVASDGRSVISTGTRSPSRQDSSPRPAGTGNRLTSLAASWRAASTRARTPARAAVTVPGVVTAAAYAHDPIKGTNLSGLLKVLANLLDAEAVAKAEAGVYSFHSHLVAFDQEVYRVKHSSSTPIFQRVFEQRYASDRATAVFSILGIPLSLQAWVEAAILGDLSVRGAASTACTPQQGTQGGSWTGWRSCSTPRPSAKDI